MLISCLFAQKHTENTENGNYSAFSKLRSLGLVSDREEIEGTRGGSFEDAMRDRDKFPIHLKMFMTYPSQYLHDEHIPHKDNVVASIRVDFEKIGYHVVSVPAKKDYEGRWVQFPELLVYHPSQVTRVTQNVAPVSPAQIVIAAVAAPAAIAAPAVDLSSDLKTLAVAVTGVEYQLKKLTKTTGEAARDAAAAALHSKL
jgi:hypothetical protein